MKAVLKVMCTNCRTTAQVTTKEAKGGKIPVLGCHCKAIVEEVAFVEINYSAKKQQSAYRYSWKPFITKEGVKK